MVLFVCVPLTSMLQRLRVRPLTLSKLILNVPALQALHEGECLLRPSIVTHLVLLMHALVQRLPLEHVLLRGLRVILPLHLPLVLIAKL
jgi:hypothetical protein